MSDLDTIRDAVREGYQQGHSDAMQVAEDAIRKAATEAAEAVRLEANKHIAAAERECEQLRALLRQIGAIVDGEPYDGLALHKIERLLLDQSGLLDGGQQHG